MDPLIAVADLLAIFALLLAAMALVVAQGAAARLRVLTPAIEALSRAGATAATGRPRPPMPPPIPSPAAPTPAAPAAPAAPVAPPAAATPPSRPPAPAGAVIDARRLEQLFVEHWLVWIGGLALALGGAFLVKLSIDRGLVTPLVRMAVGVFAGLAMSAAAEWLGRRDPAQEPANALAFHVPLALAAAGAVTTYASLFAAYRLYALLPAPVAFALLAATAGATVASSLRHGPLVAALGLAGAFAVPLLIETGEPQVLPLFAYLTVVSTGSLLLLWQRPWAWLACIWLGAVSLWVMLWLAAGGRQPLVAGVFVLVQFVLFAALRGARASGAQRPVATIVRTAFWLDAGALLLIANVAGFSVSSLGCAFIAVAFVLWFASRDPALDDLIAVALALPLGLLASWPLPGAKFAAASPEPAHFAIAGLAAAVLLGGVFLVLPKVARAGRWAALSAAAPALVLVLAYWRLHPYNFGVPWSVLALALAGLELAAAAWTARRRSDNAGFEAALACYAVGVLAGTILAAVFALENAWLTVALALHLPALGWVEGRIRLPVLRKLALVVAGAVLARLALNPAILDYPLAARPIVNWLLYGYGVPALAFVAATRQFGSRADDLLVAVLEAGSIAFTTLLLTLELRHLFYGSLDAPLEDLARDSVQTLVWLALSLGLLWLADRRARPVLKWGGVILYTVAGSQAVVWQAGIANPLWTGEPVGRWLGPDVLSLAYLAPALLYGAIAWLGAGPTWLPRMARVLAAGLAFLWLSLEVRHGFRGPVLTWGDVGETEWYAYSMAWLAFAGAGFALGLWRRDQGLRRAGLAGVALVVAKVFLTDTAQLSGGLRALSFLALGAALIAFGYIYRRLRPPSAAAGGAAPV